MKFSVALKWSSYNVAGKIKKGRSILKAMSGNANFKAPNPEPDPPLSRVNEAVDNLETAATDVVVNGGGKKWTTIQNDREKELDDAITLLVNYVNFVSKGDPEIIESAAMEPNKPKLRAGKLAAPQNVKAVAAEEGNCIISWKKINGARSYKVQMSDEVSPLVWKEFKSNTSTDTRLTVTGQESGKRKWFRVMGLNAAGDGMPGDPAVVMIP